MKNFPENLGFKRDIFSIDENEWEFDSYVIINDVYDGFILTDDIGTLICCGEENITEYAINKLKPIRRRNTLKDLLDV